jgi:hypothetical protein
MNINIEVLLARRNKMRSYSILLGFVGLLLVCCFALSHPVNAQSTDVDVTGTWELGMAFPNAGVVKMVMGDMRLTQAGSKINGSINERPVKGTINGANVTFAINFETTTPEGFDVTYSGKVADKSTMRGTVTFPQYGSGTWTTTRK